MRLDRYLAEAGIGTRTEVKKIIAKGRVTVNKATVRDPSCQLEGGEEVTFDGNHISVSEFEYYMLNKPAGIISEARVHSLKRGTKIPEGEERVAVDLIRESARTDLFPAGRLDRDTEGLLLITNDGALAHRLLSPRSHVEKCYYTELSLPPSAEEIRELETGVDIGDEKPTKNCRIKLLGECSLLIFLTEGRYHQIKRMFGRYGQEVTSLKRLKFGPLELDANLKPGEYRRLTAAEEEQLKNW